LGMCVCVRAHAQVCIYSRAEELMVFFYYRIVHVYTDLKYRARKYSSCLKICTRTISKIDEYFLNEFFIYREGS